MILLDSCGWIEIAGDAGNAAWFEGALLSRAGVMVPSLCLFEVYRHIERHFNRPVAQQVAAVMQQQTVVGLDAETALGASEFSRQYKLAALDALIYATAHRHQAELWTQDAGFKGLPGVQYRAKRGAG